VVVVRKKIQHQIEHLDGFAGRGGHGQLRMDGCRSPRRKS
jgi:hypothetical protein